MITVHTCTIQLNLAFWTFPGGERNVSITGGPVRKDSVDHLTVYCHFKGSDDLIDLLLVVNALRYEYPRAKLKLVIPYFPFARQDRVMNAGEPFALQVAASIVNSCGFNEIVVHDPHSDVLAGMFPPGVLVIKEQWELISNSILWSNFYDEAVLISPDAGALKKIYKVAKETNLPVVCANKVRNTKTGEIVSTEISDDSYLTAKTAFIVDDICDGGRTFIELAKTMRAAGFKGKLILCITHGIFSKGKEVILEHFDDIFCVNDLTQY